MGWLLARMFLTRRKSKFEIFLFQNPPRFHSSSSGFPGEWKGKGSLLDLGEEALGPLPGVREQFLLQLQARRGGWGLCGSSRSELAAVGENNVLTIAIVPARLPCRLHRLGHKGSVPPQLWDSLFPTAPQEQLLLTPVSWRGGSLYGTPCRCGGGRLGPQRAKWSGEDKAVR